MGTSAHTEIEKQFDTAEWLTRLGDTLDETVRRAVFEEAPLTANLAGMLHSEVLRFAYADVDRAARFAQAAGWLAGSDREGPLRAFAWRSQGHVDFARGHHAEAVRNYEAAIGLLERTNDEVDLGRTLNSGLQALIYLGEYDRALEWADRARAIFARHGDELRLARLASNMGNILFRQDRHADAMLHYEAAREPLSRLGEPRDLAAVLSNMAVCCTSLHRFQEALEHYQAAREHCVRHNLSVLVAAADYNIAYLHYLRADYVHAARLYRAARAHAEQAGDLYHVALCDLDESEMCLELNLSDEAARLAQSAAVRFEQTGMSYERAKAIVNQAMAASHTGDFEDALGLLRQARKLFDRERNQVWPALIDLYRAILRYQQGKYAASERFARKAARVLAGSALIGKAALCDLLRTQLLWKKGKLAEARQACLRLLETLNTDAGPSLRFHIQFVLGQVEEDLGNSDAAWKSYQSAREEIENLRSRLWADDAKISILNDKLAVYEALVRLALERRGDKAESLKEAFAFVQQAKSRTLADQIALPWCAPGANAQLEERLKDLRQDLNWHYRQIETTALLAKSGSSAELAALRRQAREQEERLARSMSELYTGELPRSAAEGAPLLSVDQIRDSLAPDAMLLEYYAIGGMIYVCVLSGKDLRILPLAPVNRVRDLLRRLQLQFEKFRLPEKYVQTFESAMLAATLAHLSELHDLLIAPIRPLLEAGHLIIAPHSFLHQLPFHALHSCRRFLMDDFSIAYAPSASIYALCAARESCSQEGSLVLGISDADAPFAEAEGRAAAAQLPGAKLFEGAAATAAVLREHGPASRYIHIATHGYFRSDNPMFSSIRLGDSHLNLFDLYQIPLSAELVTFSACSTGVSGVVGADELLGLLRGLFYAGVRGVLASLWDVQDRTTSDFMRVFYQHLGRNTDRAEALRAAMKELRQSHPHPYYWAPFVLVGKYANDRKDV